MNILKGNWMGRKISISDKMMDIFKISSGTLFGQCISFVTLPLFTRLFGAVIIGQWTLITSLSMIINTFSDLGLSNAVMVEEDDNKVYDVYRVTSTISLMIILPSSIVVYFYCKWFNGTNTMEPFLCALFVAIYSFTLQQINICYSWMNRKGQYSILMKNPVVNQLAVFIIGILLWCFGLRVYGYFIAMIVGQIVTYIHMKRFLPKWFLTFSSISYKEVFSRHREFVAFQLPTNIVTGIKGQLPTVLINSFFGAEMLGYYSISVKILNIPINLLANAIGKVFFKTTSEMVRKKEDIGEFTIHNIIRAMKIATIPLIFMVSFGDIAVEIIFGVENYIAGNIFRIVVFQNFFYFLMMSSQGLSMTLRKQQYAMVSGIAQSLGVIVSLVAGRYLFKSIYAGVGLMSVIFIVIQIIYFCALFKVMNVRRSRYLICVVKYLGIVFLLSGVIRGFLVILGVRTMI